MQTRKKIAHVVYKTGFVLILEFLEILENSHFKFQSWKVLEKHLNFRDVLEKPWKLSWKNTHTRAGGRKENVFSSLLVCPVVNFREKIGFIIIDM